MMNSAMDDERSGSGCATMGVIVRKDMECNA